jgi:hypothetical protein
VNIEVDAKLARQPSFKPLNFKENTVDRQTGAG